MHDGDAKCWFWLNPRRLTGNSPLQPRESLGEVRLFTSQSIDHCWDFYRYQSQKSAANFASRSEDHQCSSADDVLRLKVAFYVESRDLPFKGTTSSGGP